MKKNNVANVVSRGKERSERSQKFHLNKSEVKMSRERSQGFHFKSSERKTA